MSSPEPASLQRDTRDRSEPGAALGSLWVCSGGAQAPYPRLQGTQRASVAIVGAGFTGLSTALNLLERQREVTVIESGQPGHGASGRNGGQVIPALRDEPIDLERRFGPVMGRAMAQAAARSADRVFELIERHHIDCDAVRTGWIQGALGARAIRRMRQRLKAWEAIGQGTRWLEADEVARMSGSSRFDGAWMLNGAGSVQPLKYSRGLAQAVQRQGGRIFGDSPVLELRRHEHGWKLRTATGELQADQVVLATNGYTDDLWPGLKRTVVPLYSMQVASEPLPSSIGERILPGGQTMTDSRNLVNYFRKDAEGRFVIGSRGPYTEHPDDRACARLVAAARSLYPELANVAFPYRWAGRVAMTVDHLPKLLRLAPGLLAALGYNGRGVAMATLMGSFLAEACIHGDDDLAIGYPVSSMSPIPFHFAHRWGTRAMIAYYRAQDMLG